MGIITQTNALFILKIVQHIYFYTKYLVINLLVTVHELYKCVVQTSALSAVYFYSIIIDFKTIRLCVIISRR